MNLYCASCGTQMIEDALFCSHCGNRVTKARSHAVVRAEDTMRRTGRGIGLEMSLIVLFVVIAGFYS